MQFPVLGCLKVWPERDKHFLMSPGKNQLTTGTEFQGNLVDFKINYITLGYNEHSVKTNSGL